MRELIGRQLRRCAGAIRRLAWLVYTAPQEAAFLRWTGQRGDHTLRLDYELNEKSVVLDLGGFEGQWASDIYARFRCRIFVAEIAPEYVGHIRKRFARNPDIVVLSFGLGPVEKAISIHHDGDQTRVAEAGSTGAPAGMLRTTETVLAELGIDEVDLVKVNIEGAEYELISDWIEKKLISRFKDIQVQFHGNVYAPDSPIHALRERLKESHECTWRHEYLWENWRRKSCRL